MSDPLSSTPPESAPLETAQAAASPEAASSLLDMAGAGGPVLYLLGALSVAALGVMLAKLVQMRGVAPSRKSIQPVFRAVEAGEIDEGVKAAGKIKGPLGPIMKSVLEEAGSLPFALLREKAQLKAEAALEVLRSHLRFLEVIAMLAPLLGLLGTVLGMIDAFHALASAAGRADPTQLSGGIWEALLTTAAGLGVAIPVTAAVNWFDRRGERLAHVMEQSLTHLFLQLELKEQARHGGERGFLKAAD
jgi:biopolymer transport protein ExbB